MNNKKKSKYSLSLVRPMIMSCELNFVNSNKYNLNIFKYIYHFFLSFTSNKFILERFLETRVKVKLF